jgi:hypothetical protein
MLDNVSPTPVIGLPAYYQGRPNTRFLARYGTLEQRSVRVAS